MKEIKPNLKGIDGGGSMYLASQLKKARLTKERVYCGTYRQWPLYATSQGYVLQIADDEPEEHYK